MCKNTRAGENYPSKSHEIWGKNEIEIRDEPKYRIHKLEKYKILKNHKGGTKLI